MLLQPRGPGVWESVCEMGWEKWYSWEKQLKTGERSTASQLTTLFGFSKGLTATFHGHKSFLTHQGSEDGVVFLLGAALVGQWDVVMGPITAHPAEFVLWMPCRRLVWLFFSFAFEITLISVAVLIYFEAPRCYFGITDEVWAVNSWQGL